MNTAAFGAASQKYSAVLHCTVLYCISGTSQGTGEIKFLI